MTPNKPGGEKKVCRCKLPRKVISTDTALDGATMTVFASIDKNDVIHIENEHYHPKYRSVNHA